MAVLLLAGQAGASLMTDPNGMLNWKGSINLTNGSAELSVDVEYCVYAPGKFDDSFAVPAGLWDAGRYYYAYQIFNDLGYGDPMPPSWQYGYVTRFSVGLMGDEQPADIGYVDGTGDATPTSVDINNIMFGQIGWNFQPQPPDLSWGKTSDVLFFSSPFPPERWSGTVSGNGAATSYQFPNPIPEPAALALLGAGLAAALRARRRRD